ncbi:phycocyanobilin lyase alpha subunit protein [Halorhabdus tiamatea SARL4B]|uniref:PBS lyase HEAT domain repeat-containing protein n=1 Tax=Halorhabdus tiamatea SARL4B TaxID=1033806 RepID=F7PP58_9EURY|nr:HEAT repeat domain-containing protein [Halorhabdus tiamatea]ERJ07148.1 phycocyanobilin lyase alpha subunit protein [Halorhabdus tiamatea SARL4B]CCQ32770.1 PBS lyase HEAT domain repeat-containing protein [Halorhabdus tiamatea SARL4B]
MTNGDDDAEPDETDGASGEENADLGVEDLEARLDDAEETLDAAETEADLDDVEETLSAIEDDLADAELPEPDEDEDEEDPQDALADRLSDLRDGVDEQRGPYVEDAAEDIEAVAGTVGETRWTEDGAEEVLTAVESFGDAVAEHVDVTEPDSIDTAGDALSEASDAVEGLDLDPDDDSVAIASLLDAAETLADDVEAAEAFGDLSVREQLRYDGFYEVIEGEHRKDYPPELNAVLSWEKRYKESRDPEDVEQILRVLDLMDSDFMEENVLETLERVAPPEAFEPVHQRAQRRDKQAIRVLGKIGDDRAVETLVDFLDGDPALQRVTLRALGEIGSQEATQAVANSLDDENDSVRSSAARALGLLGDTRAIEPLADVLAEDDADDARASAAWALNQIGTERAIEIAAEYADDRAYVVQTEAEKAANV